MREVLAFRLSPETTWDENIKARVILSFDIGFGAARFAGDTCQNEAKTHNQDIVKLTASRFPDFVALSRGKTNPTLFDVPPATSVTQFLPGSAHSASQGIHDRLQEGAGSRQEAPKTEIRNP